MRHTFIIALLALLASCTTDTSWVSTCPSSPDIYHRHQFDYLSIHPDSEGCYTYVCRHCSLQYRHLTGARSSVHYGSVSIYRSPQTGKFDTYIVTYLDDDHQEVHIPIDPSTITR